MFLSACGASEETYSQIEPQQDCVTCPELIKVDLPDGESFWLGKTEVTVAQYAACVEANFCTYNKDAAGHAKFMLPTHPQGYLSYRDSQNYIRFLRELTGKNYRLPTKEEWLIAATNLEGEYEVDLSISNSVAFVKSLSDSWGRVGIHDLPNDYCNFAWGSGRRCTDDKAFPRGLAAAGTFGPNPRGLYEFVGSMSEWTSSCDEYENDVCLAYISIGASYHASDEDLSTLNPLAFPPDLTNRAFIDRKRYGGRIWMDRKGYEGRQILYTGATGIRVLKDTTHQ